MAATILTLRRDSSRLRRDKRIHLRYIASDVHLSAQREFQCGTVFVKNIYIYIYRERERERER